MRLLVLDHFFGQDIEALRSALAPSDEMRLLPYDLLREEAMRVFPEEVAAGLEPFARPEFEQQRQEWAQRLRGMLHEQFMAWPFDAFVAPSDIFFYIRAAPEVCHELGVPFVVVQKETTISGLIMDFADEVRRYAPPIADAMTVCGDRLEQFWRKAGGGHLPITVTGQPRFDFYRHPDRWPAAHGYGSGGPSALFFSYHIDHHHPTEGQGIPVWSALHEQTEHELWALARDGWRVLVKPHPQQPWQAERRRIRAAVGDLLDDRVFLVDPLADARRLIVGADVVIGFQTTAMIEAMIARRPIVYTGWDPEAKALTDQLIPFGRWPDVVHVVEDQRRFASMVEAARTSELSPAAAARADEIVEHYLGKVTGHAADDTIAEIRRLVATWESARTPETDALRAELAARRPPLRLGIRSRQAWRRLRPRLGAALGR